jgi:hypothetical protein
LVRALRIFACSSLLSLSGSGRAVAQDALEPVPVPPDAAAQQPDAVPALACPAWEVRTRNGLCLPQSTTPVAAQKPPGGRLASFVADDKADSPTAAILVNPIAMIAVPILIPEVDFALPLELQAGGPYVALDVQIDIVTGTIGGVGGTIGPRFFPGGGGLEGFYMVPRIGGTTYSGFVAGGELGYAAWASAFTINVGAGIIYISGSYPVLETVAPTLNLSIGLGG